MPAINIQDVGGYNGLGTPPLPSLISKATTGDGTAYNLGSGVANFGVQLVTTGSPSSVSVTFQGSLDDVNYYPIGSAMTGTGIFTFSGTCVPFVKLNIGTLSGGTAPTVSGRIVGTSGGGGGSGGVTLPINLSTQVTGLLPVANGGTGFLVATNYGADPTGVLDSTTAFNNAAAAALAAGGGTVYAPAGNYKITGTVTFLGNSSTGTVIHFKGDGRLRTYFLFHPSSASQPCFLRSYIQYSLWSDFTIVSSTVGQGYGISDDYGTGSGGTIEYGNKMLEIQYSSLARGWNCGGNWATSENLVELCSATGCTYGAYCENFNTLDIVFLRWETLDCAYGTYCNDASHVFFDKCSCGSNTTADFFVTTGGAYSFRDTRVEANAVTVASLWIGATSNAGMTVEIDGYSIPTIIGTGSSTLPCAILSQGGVAVKVQSSIINGEIQMCNTDTVLDAASLSVTNSCLLYGVNRPYVTEDPSNRGLTGITFFYQGNLQLTSGGLTTGPIADSWGVYTGQTAASAYNYSTFSTVFGLYTENVTSLLFGGNVQHTSQNDTVLLSHGGVAIAPNGTGSPEPATANVTVNGALTVNPSTSQITISGNGGGASYGSPNGLFYYGGQYASANYWYSGALYIFWDAGNTRWTMSNALGTTAVAWFVAGTIAALPIGVSWTATGSGTTGAPVAANVAAVTVPQNALGTTSVDGILLVNATASTAAVTEQWPGMIHLSGTARKTAATAASQVVDFTIGLQPQTGSSTTTGNLVISYQIAGGGYTQLAYFTNTTTGLLGYPALFFPTQSSIACTGNLYFYVSGDTIFYKSTTGNQAAFTSSYGMMMGYASTVIGYGMGPSGYTVTDVNLGRVSAGLACIAGGSASSTVYLNIGYGGSAGTALIGMPALGSGSSAAGGTLTLQLQAAGTASGNNNGGLGVFKGGAPNGSGAVSNWQFQSAAGVAYSTFQDTGVSFSAIPVTAAGAGSSISGAPNVVTVSGTSKTLALTDANAMNICTNGSAVAITIPLHATVAWINNTIIQFLQAGAGTVTITGAAGVTVNGTSGGSYSTPAQYKYCQLICISTDTWIAT